jgi:hypothetical protein
VTSVLTGGRYEAHLSAMQGRGLVPLPDVWRLWHGGAMSEFEINNRLAPETVPTVRGEDLLADFMVPMSPEELANLEREVVDAHGCAACSMRVIALARIRAALESCACREVSS